MPIQLLDLNPQNAFLIANIKNAIDNIFNSNSFILGKDVGELECELANYLGVKYTLGVSSGTDALLMALMAVDIKEGDEVITSPYTFFATAGSISRLGAIPKFVDINPLTFNIDPSKIESAITPKTRAIMPVHLFGQSAQMNEIKEIAVRNNLIIIEDVAQALGSTFDGKMAGAIGDLGCFSFFPSKNLGCFGDAGLVCTNDEKMYEKLLSLRNHGMSLSERYIHNVVGGNFRIDTIQAVVLREKLPYLNEWIEQRRSNAKIYHELFHNKLSATVFEKGIIELPTEHKPAYHSFNQYVIKLTYRDDFLELAKNKSVGVAVYYPLPLHLQPCFGPLGYEKGNFPISEDASRRCVALPIYPGLKKEQIEEIVDLVIKCGRDLGLFD